MRRPARGEFSRRRDLAVGLDRGPLSPVTAPGTAVSQEEPYDAPGCVPGQWSCPSTDIQQASDAPQGLGRQRLSSVQTSCPRGEKRTSDWLRCIDSSPVRPLLALDEKEAF